MEVRDDLVNEWALNSEMTLAPIGLVLAHKKRKAPFYKLTCFLSATLRMRMMFACCSRRDLRLRFLPCPAIIDEALVEEALRFSGLSFLSFTSLGWDNLSSFFFYSSIACFVLVR